MGHHQVDLIYALWESKKEKRGREKGPETLLKELMSENFTNLVKEMDMIQKTQKSTNRDEHKEIHSETHYNQIVKSQREFQKQQEISYLSYTRELHKTISGFFIRNLAG